MNNNKIQLIKYPPLMNFPDITVSNFEKFKSLDAFEYNLINLNNYSIFIFDYPYGKSFNGHFIREDDFNPLKEHIEITEKTNFIVSLPQNLESNKGVYIKNNISNVIKFIKFYFNTEIPYLFFGETETEIGNKKFKSDFTFKNLSNLDILTKDINDNPTTIKMNNLIFTTLKLENNDEILNFIDNIFSVDKNSDIPDWFYDEEWFDDKKQREIIINNNKKIEELSKEINSAENQLKTNDKYKSILYKNGKSLEKTVRFILQRLLDYDLSNFKDEKKEDFLIELENVTFIGEIKGVNSNLKSSHLSELDLHYTKRVEYTKDNSIEENLKPLIIVNRFRQYPPKERRKIEEEQINNAINKYEHILIITVESLLHLFEKFNKKEIKSDEIIERFSNEYGLFKN